MPNPIRLEAVSYTYDKGDRPVLREVGLTIAEGEIVLLTGPSGSGKTTLLTLVGALRAMQAGSCTVLGQQLMGATESQRVALRRRIGFIFQQHNLLEFLTARQNVELMFQLHPEVPPGEASDRAAYLLQRVGLGDRLDYLPSRLSGGQKQRVAIARALATGPKLILADEPTASLDSQTGREVVQLLQELARDRGCPILLVTHDSRVLHVADRILAMEDGRLSESNVPATASP